MSDALSFRPAVKLLGRKAYGSIPHLPGSRMGSGDHHCDPGQARIATERPRDRYDRVIVTEKLDGSNTAIVRHHNRIWALNRAGYLAETSPYSQHRHFAAWVAAQDALWRALLDEGEQLSGEWLIQAHGTRYALPHAPWVVFDAFDAQRHRWPWAVMQKRLSPHVVLPHVLHDGSAYSVTQALRVLGDHGFHGALDPPEGAVWRVERRGQVDFLVKFVRPEKVDGCFLPEITGGEPIVNMYPADFLEKSNEA